MTVTTPVAALVAAATRERTLGNYAYAAALSLEASQNAVQVADVAGSYSNDAGPHRILPTTAAAIAAIAANAALAASSAVSSHNNFYVKGHDGTTITG